MLISEQGLSALPGFEQWARLGLEEDFEAGTALIYGALQRLSSCSTQGPVKVFFMDTETTGRQYTFLLAHKHHFSIP
jgi:hypothetical protein